jgi:hypothetical protein
MYNLLIPAFVNTRSFCDTVTSITLTEEERIANHKHNEPRVFTITGATGTREPSIPQLNNKKCRVLC